MGASKLQLPTMTSVFDTSVCFTTFSAVSASSSDCSKMGHYTGSHKSNRGPVSTGEFSSLQFHCFRIIRTTIMMSIALKISLIVVIPDLHLPLQLLPLIHMVSLTQRYPHKDYCERMF